MLQYLDEIEREGEREGERESEREYISSITGFPVARILRLLLQVYGGEDIVASIKGFTVVRILRLQ